MITSQSANVDSLVKQLARTLSPNGRFRRNDIARQWIFEGSSWVAQEVYDGGNHPLGLKLQSPDFDENTISTIEFALAVILGHEPLINDCKLIDFQHWSEMSYPHYDCGIEAIYEVKQGTLRITIHHRLTSRSKKSEAVAHLRKKGSLNWRKVSELKGNRIRSGEERQYREARDFLGDANAQLFKTDARELLQMAIETLQS